MMRLAAAGMRVRDIVDCIYEVDIFSEPIVSATREERSNPGFQSSFSLLFLTPFSILLVPKVSKALGEEKLVRTAHLFFFLI